LGNKDTDAYRESYKGRYLLLDIANWQVATAYSAPEYYWRDQPLSAEE
jgi:hypothetical protein